jgi:hypothetical protein
MGGPYGEGAKDREAQPNLTDEEMLRAREEKRAELAADRKTKRDIVIVNTGDGKGKTTAYDYRLQGMTAQRRIDF